MTTPAGVVAGGTVVAPNAQPQGFTAAGGAQRLSLVADVDPRTPRGQQLADAVRAVPAPVSGVLVGGVAADYADTQAGITGRLPVVLVWIVVTTLVVLFLFTGSVVLPLKALALNIVSLGATLGVLVWVFQDGHLSGLLGGSSVTGTVDTSMPSCCSAVLRSRCRWTTRCSCCRGSRRSTTRRGDNEASRGARACSARAGSSPPRPPCWPSSSLAFVTSGMTNIKQLGSGVAFAILLDATIIRGLLVPAFMGCSAISTGGPPHRCGRCTAGSGSPRAARPPSRHRHRHRLRRRKASRPSPQGSDPLLPGQGVLLPGCDARGRPPAEPLRAAFRVHRRRGGASPGARRVAVSRSRSGRRSSG